MIEQICPTHLCTGCGACVNACPKGCITLPENVFGVKIASINSSKCIDCCKCQRVCHINHPLALNKPSECLAALSLDYHIRSTSASGGIATEIYRLCLRYGIFTAGVKLDPSGDCFYIPIESQEDLEVCRNSKYVFSDTLDIYKRFRQALDEGREAIFIGLPCQCAGLLKFLGKRYDNLTLVDIICHGTAPTAYLKAHLKNVARGNDYDSVSFRETTKFRSRNYVFALRKHSSIIYKKTVYDNDSYQVGYHKALIYRDNCYHCNYARPERIGDITIGDFSGLGRLASTALNIDDISCVLVNTEQGKKLIERMADKLAIERRPLNEALEFEHQLQGPSIPHSRRNVFLSVYAATNNFENAAKAAIGGQMRRYHIKKILHVDKLRILPSKLFPQFLKTYLKRILK